MDDESINKKCKQKIFASNMNTREISIYINIRVANCLKALKQARHPNYK